MDQVQKVDFELPPHLIIALNDIADELKRIREVLEKQNKAE